MIQTGSFPLLVDYRVKERTNYDVGELLLLRNIAPLLVPLLDDQFFYLEEIQTSLM
jgi:hypothetical protein